MVAEIVTEFAGFDIGTVATRDGDVRKEFQREGKKDRKSLGRLCCRRNLLGYGNRWLEWL